MQIGVDVKCIRTNFGGCGLSDFGDTATLKNGQISPSDLVNYGIYLNFFFGKLWAIFL